MSRTKFLAASVAAASSVALGAYSFALQDSRPQQQPGAHQAHAGGQGHGQHTQYLDCAKACDDCARICNLCSTHCARLAAGGKQHHLQTLATCQDCATICKAASEASARLGPFAGLICNACADACRRCGEACEQHGGDDPLMKQCAQECRKCEQACRAMAGQQPAGR